MPKAKRSQPLMVVATLSLEEVSNYKLARFEGNDGPYITNANLEQHVNPFNGEFVKASKGKKVDNIIDPDTAAAAQCPECAAYNIMPEEHAARYDSINCVVCSHQLNYTTTADEDGEDEDESDVPTSAEDAAPNDSGVSVQELDGTWQVIGDDTGFSYAQADDEDAANEAVDDIVEKYHIGTADDEHKDGLEDGEEGSADEDDADEEESSDEEDLTMMDVVETEDANVTLVQVDDDTIAAIVENTIVATLASTNKTSFKSVTASNFSASFDEMVAKNGLKDTLAKLDFEPTVLKANTLLAKSLKKVKAKATAKATKMFTAHKELYATCMDVAAAGSLKGMFAKSGLPILHASFSQILKEHGVANASKVSSKVLSTSIAQYNEALVATADDLMKKGESSVDVIKEQIEGMEDKVAELEDTSETETARKTTASLSSRLGEPFKKNAAAPKTPETASDNNVLDVTNLFKSA